MLIPARMKKIVVVGLNDDRGKVLSVLHDLRAVQIEPVSSKLSPYFSQEKGAQLERALAAETQRFKTLVAALPPVGVDAKVHFPTTDALLEAAKAITIDDKVHHLKKKEDELLTLQENLGELKKTLEEFSFFNEPLGLLRARSVFSFFAVVEEDKFSLFRSEVQALSRDAYLSGPHVSDDGKAMRIVVIVPKENAEAFAKVTSKHGARLFAIPSEYEGTPSQAITQINQRLAEISREMELVKGALLEIAKEWYSKILPIEEELVVEVRKAEVAGRLGRSRSSFALEGWIPQREIPRVESALSKVTGGRHQVIVTDEHEGAPTLMRNPPGFRDFELFIRFFSIPQAGEVDPTLVFSLVFPIFFGFMLGDAGYAGFILAVCLWMIWRIGNPKAGPTIVPKFLVNFTTTIMPPPAMKQLAKTLVPGCLIGIGLGVVFDSYFGFPLSAFTMGHFDFALIPWSTPAGQPNMLPGQLVYVAKLLLFTVYVGIAMVTLGLIFGAVNAYFHKNWRHLAGKVCWILLAWGISLAGLSLVHHYPGSWLIAYHAYFYEYLAMLVVGAVGVLATEGPMAAVEIPTIVSHVLSYARLVGILLASVILAFVVNTIAITGSSTQAALITHGVGYAILAFVLVLVVAVFNIILGVVEPGIQGARLLYVEHFSKFYTGNGKPFVPFGATRKYTHPQEFEPHSVPTA